MPGYLPGAFGAPTNILIGDPAAGISTYCVVMTIGRMILQPGVTGFGSLCISAVLFLFSALAQERNVAITVDDLPFAGDVVSAKTAPTAEIVNRKLLTAFRSGTFR
jgi:hypothetical protein